MAETTVGSGQCQVMVLSPERKWDILARRGRLELLRNTATNQYRMVARDTEGAGVLINSNVVLSRKYRKMSDKFFSWNDGSKAYGFQFFTSEEMEGFLLGFDAAVNSEGARPDPPPIPRRTESGSMEAHPPTNPTNPFAAGPNRTSLGTAPVLPTPPAQPVNNPFAAAATPVRSSNPDPTSATAPTQPAVTRLQSKPSVSTPPTSMTSPPRAPVPPSAPAPPPAPSAPRPPGPPPAPAPPSAPAAPRPPAPPGAGGPPPPPPPPLPVGGLGGPGGAKKLTMAEEIAMKKLKKSAGPPPESSPSPSSTGGSAPAGGSGAVPKGPMGGIDLMGDMAKKLAERRAKSGEGGDAVSKFEPKREEERKEEPAFRRPSGSGTLNPPSPGGAPKGGDVSPKPWRARSTSNSAKDEPVVTRAEFEEFKREVLGEIKKMKEEILAALQQR